LTPFVRIESLLQLATHWQHSNRIVGLDQIERVFEVPTRCGTRVLKHSIVVDRIAICESWRFETSPMLWLLAHLSADFRNAWSIPKPLSTHSTYQARVGQSEEDGLFAGLPAINPRTTRGDAEPSRTCRRTSLI